MNNKRRKTLSSYTKRQRRNIVADSLALTIPRIDSYIDTSSDTDSHITSISCSSTTSSSSLSHSRNSENEHEHLEISAHNDYTNNDEDSSACDVSELNSSEYRYSSSNLSDIESLINSDDDGPDFFQDPDEENNFEFTNDVRELLLVHKIDHVASKSIIQLLNKYTNYNLPKDPRTLLRTPRQTTTIQIEGGEYYHFGVEYAIIELIKDAQDSRIVYTNNVNLLVNIDGAPLHNSTDKGIWPIQISSNLTKTVYAVGIFYGPSKPKNTDQFLRLFVDEIKHLINGNLNFHDEIFTIRISAFVCDAPAKSMALNTKGHAGYDSCPTCKIKGIRIDNVTCFPNDCQHELRTDDDFKNGSYLGTYQLGETVLNEIPHIGLVTGVPRDYMHLVCLGIMRKLLFLWKYGPENIKLKNEELNAISDGIDNSSSCMPTTFARRPRPLKHVKKWKATECRRFLLYDGPVVLKNILSADKYANFIRLHVAIRLLTDPCKVSMSNNIDLAETLLKRFVETYETIYGQRYVSYNVHNLLHVVSDVRIHGCLDNFSAFRFENFIFCLKKLLRKHNQTLPQIVRRIKELDEVSMNINNKNVIVNAGFTNVHRSGPSIRNIRGIQYKTYKTESLTIKCNDSRNNCVILHDGIAVRCLNFVKTNERMYIIGSEFCNVREIFSDPVSSLVVDCFIGSESEIISNWEFDRIKTKACAIPCDGEFAILPLLHRN